MARPNRPPTAAELEEAITLALEAGDVDAAATLLRMLAVVDPHRAEALLAVIKAGLAARSAAPSSSS